MTYLDDVFGPAGHLSRASASYAVRPGQVALARLVDDALSTGTHAVAEGPCGTGKGIAYAVPASYHAKHSGKKVLLVTANLALQEQLLQKDLPALQKALPWEFTFGSMKGKGNYVCREKADLVDLSELSPELAWFVRSTKTGDKRELPVISNPRDWSRVSTTSDDCVRESCEYSREGECYYYRAKEEAEDVDLLVTNMHVLAAHLAVYQTSGLDLVLPHFDAVVVDEAHELPEVTREFFGYSLSERSFRRYAQALGKAVGHKHEREVLSGANWFFRSLAELPGEAGSKYEVCGALEVDSHGLLQALYHADRALEEHERPDRAVERLRGKTAQLHSQVSELVGEKEPSKAYWVDLSRSPRVESRPLECGGILQKYLFDRTESVVLLSATLTTTPGNFRFMRRELGVPEAVPELAVPSPFDFRHQVLAVLPEKLPDHQDAARGEAAGRAISDVIEACGGRTLALFSSFRSLKDTLSHVRTEHPCLYQDRDEGLSRAELVRRFSEEPETCLFGVDSFWTGVDVPGESLTALVVDKLPFEHQDDPVCAAKKRADPEAFWGWYTARALLKFRQGVGRLVRSVTDVGVVVILDPRLKTKRYGKWFSQALGPVQKSRKVGDIAEFLRTAHERSDAARAEFQEIQASMELIPRKPERIVVSLDC